ncbi:MAG TPA: anthranilate phosphoribosyltransferase [Blastocatellia bacterium]|nr:anthranilate phosphoribosyltransferase [Blastocatellia bacterium]
MLSELLNKLITRRDLAQAEAAALLEAILADDATDSRIAAALVALASKGETEEELAGFAQTMRTRCSRIAPKHSRYIDTCGTGGSVAKTFNVSTAAAFVVAAAGVPVAKHGNVGVTSRAGSADALGALGVKVDLPPERAGEIFDEIGVCFMFAPLHHSATKRVAMVRRDLGVRTIFNLLGPLTNPAGAPFQVAGVSSEAACEKVARALARLGTRRAWVVRGEDGLDEITLAGKTVVYSASPGGPTEGFMAVERFEVAPEDFGLRRAPIDHLRGGSAQENAAIISDVLEGRRKDEARDLVLINAAASLFVAGAANSLDGAVEMAAHSIETGAALAKLHELRRVSQSAL